MLVRTILRFLNECYAKLWLIFKNISRRAVVAWESKNIAHRVSSIAEDRRNRSPTKITFYVRPPKQCARNVGNVEANDCTITLHLLANWVCG